MIQKLKQENRSYLIALNRLKNIFALVLICGVFTACGGGGGGNSSSSNNGPNNSGSGSGSSSVPAPPPNENLSGLWDGTISEDGITYATRGLIFDEDVNDGLPADFYAISSDAEAIYLGSISLNGTDFQGSAGMYQIGGGLFGQSTITGVGNAKGTIRATGTSDTGAISSISLDYDASYDRPSSLDTVAGIWNNYDLAGNIVATMTIQNNGSFSGNNAAGCQYAGEFSIINSNRNLYQFEFDYSGCVLDGYVAEGYSAFFDESGADDRMETVYMVKNDGQTQGVIFLEMSRSSD